MLPCQASIDSSSESKKISAYVGSAILPNRQGLSKNILYYISQESQSIVARGKPRIPVGLRPAGGDPAS